MSYLEAAGHILAVLILIIGLGWGAILFASITCSSARRQIRKQVKPQKEIKPWSL